MGKITRTNFGLHERVILTNDQVINLPLTPVVLLPGIPGKIVFQQASSLWLDWTADYGAIDANAVVFMGIDGMGVTVTPLEENSGVAVSTVTALLAEGHSTFITMSSVAKISGGNDVLAVGFATSGGIGGNLILGAFNNGVPFDGGDPANRLVVDIYYHVVEPLPAVS